MTAPSSNVIDLTGDDAPIGVSGGTLTPASRFPTTAEPKRLRLVVLCGTIGSGKTTLSKAWCALRPEWTRVCQDELRDRASCEAVLRMNLSNGRHGIVDRMNHDRTQRAYWLEIGRQYGAEVCVLILTTPYAECERRLSRRYGHESLKSPEQALALLPRLAKQFRVPSDVEGFDRIIKLSRDLPLNFTTDDIDRIIARMDEAPKQPTLDSLFRAPRSFPPAPKNAWRNDAARPSA